MDPQTTTASLARLARYAVRHGYATDPQDAAPWIAGYLRGRAMLRSLGSYSRRLLDPAKVAALVAVR